MKIDQLVFLAQDPRPELYDHRRWMMLFQLINNNIKDLQTWYFFRTNLWTMRDAGAMIKHDMHGMKFIPLLPPIGFYESVEEFKEINKQVFGKYAGEIKFLLHELERCEREGNL